MDTLKRLKYRYYFHGYGKLIFFLSLFTAFFGVFITGLYFEDTRGYIEPVKMMFSTLIAWAVLYLIFALIVRHNSRSDREKIEASVFPEWHFVDDYIMNAVQDDDFVLNIIITSAIAVMGFILIFMTLKEEPLPEFNIYIYGGFFGIFIFLYAVICNKHFFWKSIDDTAEYVRIPVDRYKAVRQKGGYKYYAIFYLPDGKYRVPCSGPVSEIIVVKYKASFKVIDYTWSLSAETLEEKLMSYEDALSKEEESFYDRFNDNAEYSKNESIRILEEVRKKIDEDEKEK